MRGFLCYLACLFTIQLSFAQLSVIPSKNGSSNYVFVKSGNLFVEKEIHLGLNSSPETEASLYLREEAQLVQGPQQQKENWGDGLLSVFQEGTSNAYDYNYWGSPVSSSQNGLFGISMLYQPQTLTRSRRSQNTSSLNGTASPLNISSRWIYTYNGDGYSSWNFVGAAIAIAPGLGFTMKGTDGQDLTIVEGRANNPGAAQRYDFRGTPNSGKIEVAVAAGELVLVGNPYPSALDLSLFLLQNSGIEDFYSSCYANIHRNNVTHGNRLFLGFKRKWQFSLCRRLRRRIRRL